MYQFIRKGSLRYTDKPGSMASTSPSGFSAKHIALLVVRFFQFVMGFVIIGLYAQDLDKARKAGKYADPKWVYAVVCGTFSVLAAILFSLPFHWLKSWFFFIVDWLVAFLLLVLFGIFGKMYISEDAEGNKGIIRMKRAVWCVLTLLFLWVITAAWGTFVFVREKKKAGSILPK
ncbi:hypothetical protein P154DRAFT_329966 [Amniculicola lignicola CBS 123094]|uniref:MARVEL domain-containing protein n=1 Tax=Amniculicola lignicola CBS 123094 TaxID=1392246 RepID=A0A6A5W4X9_9PLEO|nr:hypothetical protein P154DRAFT_329966 [Amniculicola lignicola CBS 123094]